MTLGGDSARVAAAARHWIAGATVPPLTLHAPFLLQPPSCGDDLDYLILVHTAPSHRRRRDVMRETFMSRDLDTIYRKFNTNDNNSKTTSIPLAKSNIVFLLGQSENRTLGNMIVEESKAYKAIVLGGFLDSYHNLTLKAIMSLRWTALKCPNVSVIIKLDDDVILNPFHVTTNLLPKFKPGILKLGCDAFVNNSSPINRRGKWSIEANNFKGMYVYPFPYCKGFFVALPGALVKPLLAAAAMVNFNFVILLHP